MSKWIDCICIVYSIGPYNKINDNKINGCCFECQLWWFGDSASYKGNLTLEDLKDLPEGTQNHLLYKSNKMKEQLWQK